MVGTIGGVGCGCAREVIMLRGVVVFLPMHHVRDVPTVEFMRSMSSPHCCKLLQRGGFNAMWVVRLYLAKRCHAVVLVRQQV